MANVLLDEVDKELERRGHAFCRYVDDCNVHVRSRRAGERVMALRRRCYAKRRLKANETQSAVASVTGRKCLGHGFWFAKGEVRRKVAAKPLATFKQRVRALTRRLGTPHGGGRRTSAALPGGMESLFRVGANAGHLALAG